MHPIWQVIYRSVGIAYFSRLATMQGYAPRKVKPISWLQAPLLAAYPLAIQHRHGELPVDDLPWLC